ncbi:hypothetical protein C8J56DRAFT_528333 [Mycena floridula]|nr:hypothetical protein C8J56DRAFT_528333 [Mycena floridula]
MIPFASLFSHRDILHVHLALQPSMQRRRLLPGNRLMSKVHKKSTRKFTHQVFLLLSFCISFCLNAFFSLRSSLTSRRILLFPLVSLLINFSILFGHCHQLFVSCNEVIQGLRKIRDAGLSSTRIHREQIMHIEE